MTITVSSAPAGTVTVQPGDRTPASIVIKTFNIENVTTSEIQEGVNLYFSNARAIAALSAGQSISIDANGRINSSATSSSNYTDSNTYANVRLIGYATNANVALKANIIDLTTATYGFRTSNANAIIYTSAGNWVFTANGNLILPAGGTITAPNAQEFQLQAKDANSLLRNEINLDPNNGTYMSVWSEELSTSFSTGSWATATWVSEGSEGENVGKAYFTSAEDLQDFWTIGVGSFVYPIEVSINGGTRIPVQYEGNNDEQYGVELYFGVGAVPPTSPTTITSLVFYYRTQSKIEIDYDGGEILLDGQALNINLKTTDNLDLRSGQNFNLRALGTYPVRIYTNNNTHMWEFDATGSLTLPREGKIVGIGNGPAGDRGGYISWSGNSSGDALGFNTMRLVPDLQGLEDADQYIILDPTSPGHIHIRAGGTQDNSQAILYFGGENSYVKVDSGPNPPVSIAASDNVWTFGTNGSLTLPTVLAGDTSIGTAFNTNPPGHTLTLKHNSGTGGGSGNEIKFDYGNTKIKVVKDAGATQTWEFNSDSVLTLPGPISGLGNSKLDFTTYGSNTAYLTTTSDDSTALFMGTVSADLYAHTNIQIRTNTGGTAQSWTFGEDGSLTFPDGNVQATAFTTSDAYSNAKAVAAVVNTTLSNITVSGNITGNTNGFAIGYLNIPQVTASNVTLALTDAGKHYYSTTAGSLTLTIPTNANVAFATGTAISIVVQAAGNVLVNAAGGVTLYMAGNSTAANRVVSTYGMATLMKVATDTWFINGTGVS